jgi:hypothetical protein
MPNFSSSITAAIIRRGALTIFNNYNYLEELKIFFETGTLFAISRVVQDNPLMETN